MSLIETLVSLAILLVGMVLAFAASRVYIEYRSHQERVTDALTVAQGQLENLLLRYPDDPDLTVGDHGPVHVDTLGIPAEASDLYEIRWRVTRHSVLQGLRDVSVTVAWDEGLAGQRSLSIETVRSGE